MAKAWLPSTFPHRSNTFDFLSFSQDTFQTEGHVVTAEKVDTKSNLSYSNLYMNLFAFIKVCMRVSTVCGFVQLGHAEI